MNTPIDTTTQTETKTNHLPQDVTPEVRAQWLAKARANKAAEKLETADYKRDFKDEKGWREYASKLGVQLPRSYQKPTTGRIAKFRKRVGVSLDEIRETFGITTAQEFIDCNPNWPMYAIAGLILEIRAEREGCWLQSDRYSAPNEA